MLIDRAQVPGALVPGHAIGSPTYAAPQANLMATIIRGLLAQDLPWGLVFVGMAIAVVIEPAASSPSFAVGLYLPLSTTMPIAIGGALRGLMERKSGGDESESEISSGMLYATGLVAGGSLTGVLIAGLQGFPRPPQPSMAQQILDGVGVHEWPTRRHRGPHRHRDVQRSLLLPPSRREGEARLIGRGAATPERRDRR
ncbi:MAG: OPT/YSL family transporter [Thermoanaerobaculia bacterium]